MINRKEDSFGNAGIGRDCITWILAALLLFILAGPAALAQQPVDSSDSRENWKRSEYESLKTESVHHDRECVVILGVLLTVTASILAAGSQHRRLSATAVLPAMWIAGYAYIFEKRTAILRIATFFREELGGELAWERWLAANQDAHGGAEPFLLETAVSALALIGLTYVVGRKSRWSIRSVALWVSVASLILFSVFVVAFWNDYNRKLEILRSTTFSIGYLEISTARP